MRICASRPVPLLIQINSFIRNEGSPPTNLPLPSLASVGADGRALISAMSLAATLVSSRRELDVLGRAGQIGTSACEDVAHSHVVLCPPMLSRSLSFHPLPWESKKRGGGGVGGGRRTKGGERLPGDIGGEAKDRAWTHAPLRGTLVGLRHIPSPTQTAATLYRHYGDRREDQGD